MQTRIIGKVLRTIASGLVGCHMHITVVITIFHEKISVHLHTVEPEKFVLAVWRSGLKQANLFLPAMCNGVMQ